MTPLAWTLLGIAIAASIAFPVVLVAIAKTMGKRPDAKTDTGGDAP